MTTILDNDYARLEYHADHKIVHHTFKRPIGGEHFRSVLNAGVRLLEEHGASKWLSDDRNNSAMSEEDTHWSMTDWFPRAKAAGWHTWALVVPADLMARINMKEFVDSYFQQGVRIMVFTDPAEAMRWLQKH